MTNSTTKIAIVESSYIIRTGIEHIINSTPSLTTIYSDSTLPTTLNVEANTLIINSSTLSKIGEEAIRKVLPSVEIIALIYSYTSREERVQFGEVIEITDSAESIIETLNASATATQSDKESADEEKGLAKVDNGELSEREMEIVAAVARGLINKEIADSLNISIHTVMTHRKNISRKTGIRSISGLVVYALLNGLISQTEVLK